MRARLESLAEFFAPAPLVAVGVLAVNDHLLKARFHNAVTGKLSDVALCFFLPLYLSALLGLVGAVSVRRRLAVGAIATAIAFVTLELSDAAGAWFARLIQVIGAPLGIGPVVLTRDATDLLTLVAVPVAWWYGHRRAKLVGAEAEPVGAQRAAVPCAALDGDPASRSEVTA